MAVPRLLQRAGSFADHIDTIFGKLRHGGSVIAEPTTSHAAVNSTITRLGALAQESLSAAATSALNPDDATAMSFFQTLKSFGGMFSYMTSKWAIATFVIVGLPSTIIRWSQHS
jgi:hypothetical protein